MNPLICALLENPLENLVYKRNAAPLFRKRFLPNSSFSRDPPHIAKEILRQVARSGCGRDRGAEAFREFGPGRFPGFDAGAFALDWPRV